MEKHSTQPDVKQDDPLLTYEEVADIFRVTVKSVRGWIKSGKLKSLKMGDSPKSPVRIPLSAVNALMESFRQVGNS